MFLVNSRSSLVTATPSKLLRYSAVHPGHPFSRSYGVNLPSSLTRVISHALVSSTCLPVSVCGTVRLMLARGFSWRTPSLRSLRISPPVVHCRSLLSDGFAYPTTPTARTRTTNAVLRTLHPRPPIAHNATAWCWNINQLSIAYAISASA